MACPVSVQERLRGWRCRDRLFGHRPHIGSRVRLTGGHGVHSSRRGGVLSPRPPTVLGMVMQCPGWCWGRQGWSHRTDGDGGDRSHRPNICWGVSENPDRIPEHKRRKSTNVQVKVTNDARGDKESPKEFSCIKSCESLYTCPRAPFYRETKGLLHFENTLESKEYS
jgi:hypothetical protein